MSWGRSSPGASPPAPRQLPWLPFCWERVCPPAPAACPSVLTPTCPWDGPDLLSFPQPPSSADRPPAPHPVPGAGPPSGPQCVSSVHTLGNPLLWDRLAPPESSGPVQSSAVPNSPPRSSPGPEGTLGLHGGASQDPQDSARAGSPGIHPRVPCLGSRVSPNLPLPLRPWVRGSLGPPCPHFLGAWQRSP